MRDPRRSAACRAASRLPAARWLAVGLGFFTLAAVGGAAVASTHAPPAEVPELEMVAEWGCDACEGPDLLGAVEQVTVAPDGTVFVTDAYEPVVRRFTVGGEPIAFGREGQGPGEFGLAWNIDVVGESVIEIIDVQLRRLTRLDFDGNVLSTRSLPRFPTAASYSRSQRAWFLSAMDFSTQSATVMRLDDGSEDLVAAAGGDFPLDEDGEVARFFPIAARPDGGVAIGDGEIEYRVRLYDDTGAASGDIHRPIERVAKSPEELDAERRRRQGTSLRAVAMTAAEGGGSSPAPRVDPLKRHFHLNSFRYDEVGRLWVLTGRGNESHSIFDLFDETGDFLGDLVVPGRVTRFAVAGTWLVTAAFSDDYFPVVRLWQVDG